MSTTNIQTFSGDVSVGGGLNISGSVTSTAGIDKVTLAEDATDASRRILFTTGSTGAQPLKTDAGIVYNPSTNTLTAGVFSGSGASITTLNGSNISSGTVAAARVATLNQNTTGSAATLTTARTIGGVSFNGSAAINLPGVNIAGNQNTSGTAGSVSTSVTPGSYITGSAYNGSTARTFAVDATTAATASKIVARDTARDMFARLFRSDYGNQNTISGGLAFRVNNGNDSYIRFCSDAAATRTFIGLTTMSASAGNNTIVRRHASGYIYANYFNTTPNDVSSGVTKVCIETGNDGFIRHGTAAAIKTFIGAPTTFFNAADNNVAIGNFAGSSSQGSTAVALGYEAGKTSQGTYAVAVGREAGETSQSSYGIAIGRLAGSSSQFTNAVAIGRECGKISQEEESVAVGYKAGYQNQRGRTVAIGTQSGYLRQTDQSVALGSYSGRTDQGYRGISLGYRSGYSAQGSYGIAIGYQGGYSSQPANSFYVATNSVRNQGGSYNMRYNTSTGEVSYTSSDDRVKDGETLITDAVKTLSKLRPQNYFKRTKLDPNAPEQTWYHESGLMAQEVYYSVPEMRHLVLVPPEAGDIDKYTPPPSDDPSQDPDYSVWGDGIASVDYMQMVPYLVKGVQEIVTELPRSKTTVSNTWGQNITGLVVSANTNKHKTNTVPIVNISTVSMDKSWYGVVSSDKTDSIEYDTLVDTKGDSRIWVTDTNGTLESGDLLTTSNVAPGYTQKQEGGALMNYTVAKVTQDCDFTEPLQVSIKIPKRELSNVMYYIHDESYEISLDDYEKRPSFKTSVEEIPIYFKEVVDGGETIYYQGDMEISSLKYDSLPDDAIKSVKHLHEISVEEYNTLDAVEKATYSLGTSKTYKAIQFSKSKKQIPQHDEVRILEELVDVLDENGQTVWEETGETKPVYTLVDHGTYKAALVSCKLI